MFASTKRWTSRGLRSVTERWSDHWRKSTSSKKEKEEDLQQELPGLDEDIECECCFGWYRFESLVQCPEAHLFCVGCVQSYVAARLASGRVDVPCPSSGSPCKTLLAERDLVRVLQPSLAKLRDSVRARRDIALAKLNGLQVEECPFCEYACVMEGKGTELFRCAHPACGAVSCRACKRKAHGSKSCDGTLCRPRGRAAGMTSVADASVLQQHVVEEAMTRAFVRRCPECAQAIVKEGGCNKMRCERCSTDFCYLCRKAIHDEDRYDHFGPGKCGLYEVLPDEVEVARKRAVAELRPGRPFVNRTPSAAAAAPSPMVGCGCAMSAHAWERERAATLRAMEELYNPALRRRVAQYSELAWTRLSVGERLRLLEQDRLREEQLWDRLHRPARVMHPQESLWAHSEYDVLWDQLRPIHRGELQAVREQERLLTAQLRYRTSGGAIQQAKHEPPTAAIMSYQPRPAMQRRLDQIRDEEEVYLAQRQAYLRNGPASWKSGRGEPSAVGYHTAPAKRR